MTVAPQTQSQTPKAQGLLIVFEGIDGCGKSTQIQLLKKYLIKKYRRKVVVSEWRGSPIVGRFLRDVQNLEEKPSALALSLILCADLYERLYKEILPGLAAGKIVLCDRYFYTAMVRDAVVNGIDIVWIEKLYRDLPKPDLAFYLSVNDATSMQRVDRRVENGIREIERDIRKRGKKISRKRMLTKLRDLEGSLAGGSIAGSMMMDVVRLLQHGERLYQINGEPLTVQIAQQDRLHLINRLIATYSVLFQKYGFTRVDAMQTIKAVFKSVKKVVQQKFGAPPA